MEWKEDEKRKAQTAVGKSRNSGEKLLVPATCPEGSDHTSILDQMGKRKRKEKREEGDGEDEREKPVLPQVHPVSLLRLAADLRFKKRHYRQRAHANPFSDHVLDYPSRPEDVDWAEHFRGHSGNAKAPEFADIGCGFGGLLVALAPLFPESLMLGKGPYFGRRPPLDSSTHAQDWRFASRSHNMCAIALRRFVRTLQMNRTRTSPSPVPTA